MDYQTITVWGIIKRFFIGWAVAGMLLVVVSCVKYKEFIITVFKNNTWAWFDAVMPVILMIWVLWYLLKSVFRS